MTIVYWNYRRDTKLFLDDVAMASTIRSEYAGEKQIHYLICYDSCNKEKQKVDMDYIIGVYHSGLDALAYHHKEDSNED